MECKACGAPLKDYQAFCSKCGEVTSRRAPFAAQFGKMISRGADSLSDWLGQFVAFATRPENRTKVFARGAGILLLGVALTDNPLSSGVSSLFESEPARPQLTAEGLPDFASYEDVFLSDEEKYWVTDPANVRNFPTSQGTEIVSSFEGGEEVMAREVMAFDSTSQWFKLSDGGYVWGRNLVSADTLENEKAVTFPAITQGRWSSMDTCRGQAMNVEIEITPNAIQFYESKGTLLAIEADSRGKPTYRLAMSGEGQTWVARYTINLTANGFSLLLDNIENPNANAVYHNPQAGCGRVFFSD